MAHNGDVDPQETQEWIEAIEAVMAHDGSGRAGELLDRVVGHPRLAGASDGAAAAPPGPYDGAAAVPTAYVNTIPPEREDPYPGDLDLEHRIRSLIRWNAIAT